MSTIQQTNPNQPQTSSYIPPVGGEGRRQRRWWRVKQAPWMEDIPWWLAALKGFSLLIIALMMLLPFWNVVAVSFSSAQDVMQGGFTLWPDNPTLESYRALLSGGTVLRSMRVSIC